MNFLQVDRNLPVHYRYGRVTFFVGFIDTAADAGDYIDRLNGQLQRYAKILIS